MSDGVLSPRARLLADLATRLVARPGFVRVAVDGITAAGKTTFARELAAAVAAAGRPSARLSTDDFHHVASHRHRDADRARGYYRDAYDLVSFRGLVLDPLGPDGDGRYVPKLHDLETDAILRLDPLRAESGTVLVVDGTFLQSPSLAGGWDEIIWLDVPYEAAVERGVARDSEMFGGPDATRDAFAERYHAACRLYEQDVHPREHASIVIDNADLVRPVLVRIG